MNSSTLIDMFTDSHPFAYLVLSVVLGVAGFHYDIELAQLLFVITANLTMLSLLKGSPHYPPHHVIFGSKGAARP